MALDLGVPVCCMSILRNGPRHVSDVFVEVDHSNLVYIDPKPEIQNRKCQMLRSHYHVYSNKTSRN